MASQRGGHTPFVITLEGAGCREGTCLGFGRAPSGLPAARAIRSERAVLYVLQVVESFLGV